MRAGIADTPGAAWGFARYARAGVAPLRSGDMIDQEARATRSRAAKRRGWERGGGPPRPVAACGAEAAMIAPPGELRDALADLPLAALRLEGATVERLMRLGHEAVTRLHPSDSHVPAKCAQVLMAAWSRPHDGLWPAPSAPRPLVMFRPAPVEAPETPDPPTRFRWRRREFTLRMAAGPERLMPEWWLDDPDWRGGARDYWRVEVEGGERLWLFYGRGVAVTDHWYCEGLFP